MLRKSVGLILLCVLASGLIAGAEGPAPVSKKAGYALLDLYITMFKIMALTGSGSSEAVQSELDKMVAEAKKSKAAGEIDAVYYARYTRMIGITKLIMLKDPQKAIEAFINNELSRFVMENVGEELKTEGPGAIGQMANAMAFAIVDLQIYLDTLDSRQARYDKFVKGVSPAK